LANKKIPLYSLDKESFQKMENENEIEDEEDQYSENFEKESNLD
jgi:hypothetical protein